MDSNDSYTSPSSRPRAFLAFLARSPEETPGTGTERGPESASANAPVLRQKRAPEQKNRERQDYLKLQTPEFVLVFFRDAGRGRSVQAAQYALFDQDSDPKEQLSDWLTVGAAANQHAGMFLRSGSVMLRRLRDHLRQVADQMARRPGLCCGALLLTGGVILTIALTCGRVKSVVAPARPPLRFFPADAPLIDLFLGQQQEVDVLRQEADVTAVFYYAPWCGHSISARTHFLQVALRLEKQVKLKETSPCTPSSLSTRTFSDQQQAVVGYFLFDSSPQPDSYTTYLSSALHALRRDPQGMIRFAVVTNEAVAGGVSLAEEGAVYLHRRLNSSLLFPRAQSNFTAQAICDWVFENRESLISWIQPITAKSYSLEAELQKGPALLTFLPHNPLSANRLLDQVSDVALRYQTCAAAADSRCCRSLLSERGVCELCVHRSLCSLNLDPARLRLSAGLCCSLQVLYSSSGRASVCCRSAFTPPPDSFSGLQCRSNRTLRFYLLDLQLHATLAQRLGASANLSERLFVTIVSLQEETQHVKESSQSMESFIQNFSVPFSPLHRHLTGEKPPLQRHLLIQEVTSESFLLTVMDPQKDVLLLYYSAWCGFCSVLNHVLLQLARLFQGNSALTVARSGTASFINNLITSLMTSISRSRLNVAGNDLPWEFMVDHLPSVLFFPRHRKQMSVKFPEDTPLTLPNLLRFVLQHSSPAPREQEEYDRGVDPVAMKGAGLEQEVFSLQGARERLSQQLSALSREHGSLSSRTQEDPLLRLVRSMLADDQESQAEREEDDS
ncbi:hypothetical protein DNTS_030224 [Danionella cerebrum]|uniref:TXNDC11 thioredoxin-like domain-containing protein n=1 Tax=Danionella cerebrum TaxID=2873325 RepID=A0A553Q8C5_9TELE|nr:hypothetical protein DNTS_030224 [Danionella translucida]